MTYRITALVPAKNEEQNIDRCIKSLIDWCDRVVLIDMGSTDRTASIAQKLGATVVAWHKDIDKPFIAIQKAINAQASNTKTEWVLRIDADEVVTEPLQKEIALILQQGKDAPYKAYGVPRSQYFWGGFLKGGDWAFDRLVRLYQPSIAYYSETSEVHEQLTVRGNIGYLKHPLLHYSHPTLRVAVQKFNHYTDIEAQTVSVSTMRAVWNMLALPPYIFLRWILWHHGWRDGLRGIVAGALRAWYEFMVWSKYLGHLYAKQSHKK
ncbi:MAG: glycosyltransferase family 2 protein [Candidatus Roizmanbacteria bacterium]|nr:glycosyltransferase family 2 protein [Candidatus Roizmanbacteria bacterium]